MGNTTTAQKKLGLTSRNGDAAGARKAVVEDGADVNAAVFWSDGKLGGTCTAAYVAAACGNTGALGAVLDAPGVDPNKGFADSGETPCHIACYRKHPVAVELLLARGADPNRADEYEYTPCMFAAFNGATACLRALAEGAARQGVALDVNAVATRGDWKGKTALEVALECFHPGGCRVDALSLIHI